MENVLDKITCKCISCGNEFSITPAEQKFYSNKGFPLPKRCPGCRNKKQEIHKFICCDCNREYTLTGAEVEYFKRHNLNIPKRCNSCLEDKKERNAN